MVFRQVKRFVSVDFIKLNQAADYESRKFSLKRRINLSALAVKIFKPLFLQSKIEYFSV